jgi:hypothetical protein|nr:MAG TPA: hypothetical protein [Caudoviricetes sp.]
MERKDVDALFEQILDTGGLSADMLGALKKIKDYLDEREGELASRGETTDENPPDGFSSWREARDAAVADMEKWKKNYIDAFMGRKKVEDVKPVEEEKPKEEVESFDDLFEEEG